ncbi:hypothetical protein V499_04141 [Pseudogymnoascus sp. VKM F-103]|uniref:Uncharacterized protein n=1 Tax=Pseudogymnoascus verrucosus TaxID=342668 RepID=A0A1B8GX11_9PEZI|nr:uncharacterized protein VE01_01662 [Pseudogymnoascus verrucosus]KFY76024.1 hypothetical protein V499_04141 [Pseudogymnoascus sp. VKM F-103]OBU00349.1 hypothetical protein VE01_01662 [Pseudogymnoascus verrucosus]
MSTQVVQSRGIFHGLPVFPENVKGLTAVITGANGISGQHMLRVLLQSPERWMKIICISRRLPFMKDGAVPGVVEHIALDFLDTPQAIANVLRERGVKADYVFFFSYVQVDPEPGAPIWSNAQELCRVNTLLLSNFLESLALNSIKPRRFMLQTGAKHYGGQFGSNLAPQEESDPRVLLEPNFYYDQEDCLWAYCKKHDIKWNVIRPAFILGAVPDAAMNVCFPLAVYASVRRHLGQPLDFPYDLTAWDMSVTQSSALLNSYLEEWAVLTDGAANEAFNASDDGIFTWSKFWPLLASWYGLDYIRPDDEGKYKDLILPHNPPPRGYGPPGKIRYRFSLTEWAKQPEVTQAWKDIAQQNDLSVKELHDVDRIFGFTDFAMSVSWPGASLSMAKARKLGWHGYVDSNESVREVLLDFEKLGMIPHAPALAQSGAPANTASSLTEGYAPEWLELEKTLGTRPLLTGTVEEMQGQFAALSALLSASQTPPDDTIESKDETADGIPVRIYKPKDAARTKLPIVVYYHGGGFVLGNLDTEDAWCRYLAKTTPSIVVSVDYRLGPKFKMPVMLEDSLTAFKWVYANAETLGGTKSRIFTAGTSAGGGLALLVTDALIQEGKNSHVKGVITAVPITAHPLSIPEEYKSQYTSYEKNGSGVPVADASTLNTFFEAAGCKYDDPMTFVTLSQNLSQFPPTYISTCGKDPLRDDGRVLEAMLKREGVKTKSDNYIGQPHCFWLFPNVNGEEFLANVVKGAQWVVLNSE